jgi:hypothetical protein
MSSTSNTSLRQKACLLNVHPRNVFQVVKHQKLMISSKDFFLDSIIMQNKGKFSLSSKKGGSLVMVVF